VKESIQYDLKRAWDSRLVAAFWIACAGWIVVLLGIKYGDWSLPALLTPIFVLPLEIFSFFVAVTALFSKSARTGKGLIVLILTLVLSGSIVSYFMRVLFIQD